jgi:hypothetical protein
MAPTRLPPLPVSEYRGRITRLQEELQRVGLDALGGCSSESESSMAALPDIHTLAETFADLAVRRSS